MYRVLIISLLLIGNLVLASETDSVKYYKYAAEVQISFITRNKHNDFRENLDDIYKHSLYFDKAFTPFIGINYTNKKDNIHSLLFSFKSSHIYEENYDFPPEGGFREFFINYKYDWATVKKRFYSDAQGNYVIPYLGFGVSYNYKNYDLTHHISGEPFYSNCIRTNKSNTIYGQVSQSIHFIFDRINFNVGITLNLFAYTQGSFYYNRKTYGLSNPLSEEYTIDENYNKTLYFNDLKTEEILIDNIYFNFKYYF